MGPCVCKGNEPWLCSSCPWKQNQGLCSLQSGRGTYVDSTWMNRGWNVDGLWMDRGWIVDRSWIDRGSVVDRARIVCG